MPIEAVFFKFRPRLSVEPVTAIENKALVEEILQHPDLKDFRSSHSGDIFLEVPEDLSGLTISSKLKSMLEPYKGQVIAFST